MGWTWSNAEIRYKNGKGYIAKKELCDALYTHNGDKHKIEVLKSSMVGSTYYAAIKLINKETGHKEVFAAICLTSTNLKDYYNFGYKDMDETCGPCQCNCPKGILDLLTPTTSEYANEWRKSCYENLKKGKDKDSLSKLPIGSEIKYTRYDGNEITLVKHEPAYQFKRSFWMMKGELKYISSKHIPNNYEVVKRGEC